MVKYRGFDPKPLKSIIGSLARSAKTNDHGRA